MFGSTKRKPLASEQQQHLIPPDNVAKGNLEGVFLAEPDPRIERRTQLLIGGGAGTPCSSSFHPSTGVSRPLTDTANKAASKQLEAERKRQIETAAAKRCASGRYFPGTCYRLESTIGKGSYGRVKLALDSRTGQQVAIKFLAKDLMTKQAHWIRVRREINLLTLAQHPHIIKVHEWIETTEDVLIVMEYVTGKDLFDRINEKEEKRYSEQEARMVFRQMVSALDYCHQNKIVHRDLKPENVMIDTRGCVKLIDFGFANLYHPRDHLSTNCGSPLYAAPEIVQAKPYIGPEVDIWSLGIVLYAMLVGALPFEDENLKGLYKKIGEGKFSFPDHVSGSAQDLIRGMLQVNVLARSTMQQIRLHPWVNEGCQYPPEGYVPPRPMQILHPKDEIVSYLPEYGYNQSIESIRASIIYQNDSPAFAGYCMLEEKHQREQKQKIPMTPIINISPPNQRQHPAQYGPAGTPLKQPTMASSYKEYRPIAPVISSYDYDMMGTPRYSANMDGSIPLSSIPVTPIKSKHCPNPSTIGVQHPSVSGAGSGGGIMAQAAATVVSKFRKLRDMKFGLATGSTSPRSSSRRDSRQMQI